MPTVETVATSLFLDPKNAANSRIIVAFNQFIQPNDTGFFTQKAKDIMSLDVRNKFNANPSTNAVNLATKYGTGISIEAYYKQYFNNRVGQSGGGAYPAMDAVTAAFGGFSFYVVPLGTATRTSDGKYMIKFKEIAIHVVDSFDFNGELQLGCYKWPNVVNPPMSSGECVSNYTFR